MKVLGRFLGKEAREIVRTWRLPVLGGLVLFFALTGPVLALYTPELIKSLATQQPGVIIQVPDPTWRDAYLQWTSNLSEIVAFVTLIVGAGAIAGEVSSGTATLVLTKPVSRVAFVLAKALSLMGLVTGVVLAGAAVTQLLTYVVFGEAPWRELWLPTALWLGFAAVLVALTTLLSAVLPTLAAAGTGIAVFLLASGLGFLDAVKEYSPVGLMTGTTDLLVGKDVSLVWPLATSVVVVVGFLALASALFARREL